jgi:hypothetical protein
MSPGQLAQMGYYFFNNITGTSESHYGVAAVQKPYAIHRVFLQ